MYSFFTTPDALELRVLTFGVLFNSVCNLDPSHLLLQSLMTLKQDHMIVSQTQSS